jgi:Fe-S cluster assembly protein SufD
MHRPSFSDDTIDFMKNVSLVLKENQEKTLPLIWTGGSDEIVINAKLIGRGAKLSVVGAIFLADRDELKINISIDHIAPDTSSDTLIKSVLTDRAVGSFYGLVRIKKGAKNTDTFFREDVLLLSDTAKAEAIPSLEIDENEVKAGHASTVGPADEEQLFYLMSRGIGQTEAKRLVVQGFLFPVLEKIPEKEKSVLEKTLEKHLKQ